MIVGDSHSCFIDTLGVVARTVGKEVFLPLAEECIQLGLVMCVQIDVSGESFACFLLETNRPNQRS